ncbi:hypothetical protein LCGC14_1029710 [marine sediment metagenome]|uniref:peptidyl-tRNA hydrolase n=1 Tax=marine sediment metagenome TaxID=412755 RepID=A0A0F9MZI6_9ZZZZ
MTEIKQVIIIRRDLNMRRGKMCAQAAHASIKILLDRMVDDKSLLNHTRRSILLRNGSPLQQWLDGQFTKIVLYVISADDLLNLKDNAESIGLYTALITDAGKTEFHNKPTITALAIGPDYSEKIDKVTGGLPLL